LSERLGGASIDFAAVTYLDHFDSASDIIDAVDNAELALADAIALFDASKLFTTDWPRLGSKCGDSVNDALAILLVTDRSDFLSSRRLDE
jgi:hypothetical protein